MMAKVRRRRTSWLRSGIGVRRQLWHRLRGNRELSAASRWHTAAMPDLPDVTVYVERLAARASDQVLRKLSVLKPFVLRTAVPPIGSAEGQPLLGVERLGKRVVLRLEGELFLVIHLMIAGRLRWLEPQAKLPGRIALARFDFDSGSLLLTEAGTQRRASIAPGARARGAGRAGFRRPGPDGHRRPHLRHAAAHREPHAQACADRSAAVQRQRQCVLRRNPAPRAAVAAGAVTGTGRKTP